jgi:hypothetical protein
MTVNHTPYDPSFVFFGKSHFSYELKAFYEKKERFRKKIHVKLRRVVLTWEVSVKKTSLTKKTTFGVAQLDDIFKNSVCY